MDASWRSDERAQASRLRGGRVTAGARARPDMAEASFDLTPCEGCAYAEVCRYRAMMAEAGDVAARLPDLGPYITVTLRATIVCALRTPHGTRRSPHFSADALKHLREGARKTREIRRRKADGEVPA